MIRDKIKDFIKENCENSESVYVIIRDNKAQKMYRFAVGFDAHELLGLLLETQIDVMAQMRGETKPTVETFRTVLKPEEAK